MLMPRPLPGTLYILFPLTPPPPPHGTLQRNAQRPLRSLASGPQFSQCRWVLQLGMAFGQAERRVGGEGRSFFWAVLKGKSKKTNTKKKKKRKKKNRPHLSRGFERDNVSRWDPKPVLTLGTIYQSGLWALVAPGNGPHLHPCTRAKLGRPAPLEGLLNEADSRMGPISTSSAGAWCLLAQLASELVHSPNPKETPPKKRRPDNNN